jgi:hypothetical protein
MALLLAWSQKAYRYFTVGIEFCSVYLTLFELWCLKCLLVWLRLVAPLFRLFLFVFAVLHTVVFIGLFKPFTCFNLMPIPFLPVTTFTEVLAFYTWLIAALQAPKALRYFYPRYTRF